MAGASTGIRILNLSRLLSQRSAPFWFNELEAVVINVEEPGGGDLRSATLAHWCGSRVGADFFAGVPLQVERKGPLVAVGKEGDLPATPHRNA